MFALLTIAAVGGLAWLATSQASDPTIKKWWETNKLARLASLRMMTLDQAEDGLVLSRKYRHRELEARFSRLVTQLRRRRSL